MYTDTCFLIKLPKLEKKIQHRKLVDSSLLIANKLTNVVIAYAASDKILNERWANLIKINIIQLTVHSCLYKSYLQNQYILILLIDKNKRLK